MFISLAPFWELLPTVDNDKMICRTSYFLQHTQSTTCSQLIFCFFSVLLNKKYKFPLVNHLTQWRRKISKQPRKSARCMTCARLLYRDLLAGRPWDIDVTRGWKIPRIMGLLTTYRLANQMVCKTEVGILRLWTGVRSVSHPGTLRVCGLLLSQEVSVCGRINRYD